MKKIHRVESAGTYWNLKIVFAGGKSATCCFSVRGREEKPRMVSIKSLVLEKGGGGLIVCFLYLFCSSGVFSVHRATTTTTKSENEFVVGINGCSSEIFSTLSNNGKCWKFLIKVGGPIDPVYSFYVILPIFVYFDATICLSYNKIFKCWQVW